MKILQIYNEYRSLYGGEDVVVDKTSAVIEKSGNEALMFRRSSRGMDESWAQKFRAFANGIYSKSAYRDLSALLRDERPDVVHAHNIYPMLSPSVLVACREANIPVVLSLHNYVLTCPTVMHLSHGRICESCRGGREYFCILKNCRSNIVESMAYGVRSASARKFGFFHEYVDRFIALSEFARTRLAEEGFDSRRIEVLPNMVSIPHAATDPAVGRYVAYVGRMSPEKGVGVLLDAAAKLPDTRFRLAGDGPLIEELRTRATANVEFVGRLRYEETAEFFRGARMLVIPSICYEMCPLVISEAMSHGLPVISSRIGGLPELVKEGITGRLFEPGDSTELAMQITQLWDDPAACVRLGEAGRVKAIREYGEETYSERLMSLYEVVAQRGAGATPL